MGDGASGGRAGARRGLEGFLEGLVQRELYSAAAGLVGTADRVAWIGARGWARVDPAAPADAETRFDLASLTKPATATLALALDAAGDLPLSLPVGEVWTAAHRRLASRTLESLLRHRAGLRPWTPLYARCGEASEAPELIAGTQELSGARAGTYSDLGYILWGATAERVTGAPLAELLLRKLLEPLGIAGEMGSPPGREGMVAACLADGRMEARLAAEQGVEIAPPPAPSPGQVQDGNARFLGGLAGHAGLFGTARALWALGREWLCPEQVLTGEQVKRALSGTGPYALGWARRRVRGSAGPALPAAAFGHTGFTGGSLWIDPEAGRVLVLLGHRLSPLSELGAARRRFHRLATDG